MDYFIYVYYLHCLSFVAYWLVVVGSCTCFWLVLSVCTFSLVLMLLVVMFSFISVTAELCFGVASHLPIEVSLVTLYVCNGYNIFFVSVSNTVACLRSYFRGSSLFPFYRIIYYFGIIVTTDTKSRPQI